MRLDPNRGVKHRDRWIIEEQFRLLDRIAFRGGEISEDDILRYVVSLQSQLQIWQGPLSQRRKMSNNARIFRREARERGGYTRGGVSHHGKKRKRGTGSCSNLIKKFLHGGAAHSATPLLASAYLYVSLVGAGLEKIKNNFSYINVLTSGGAELFTPRFPSNLYKEWRGPDFKADLTRCRIILF